MRNADKPLRTSLQRTYINYQEIARNNNIYHTFLKLVSGVYGFVYRSSFDNYYIIINQNLTIELQKEVFCHEVAHIIYDLPDTGYIIGIDMQYESVEKKADLVAEAI
ncbi:MAG: ImmA/IrrE family metallo-endopeptidase, partial [Halanaerobiales bacterium]